MTSCQSIDVQTGSPAYFISVIELPLVPRKLKANVQKGLSFFVGMSEHYLAFVVEHLMAF